MSATETQMAKIARMANQQNHFATCRLSTPLECCVISQGLFDYSTYKALPGAGEHTPRANLYTIRA